MSGVRERYTWHLRTPFAKAFDRTAWWEKIQTKDVHPIAALYELVRRHPRVGELRAKFIHRSWHGVELRPHKDGDQLADAIVNDAFEDLGSGPKSLHCLCLIGLKSWNQHYAQDQEYWMMSGGRLKGVDSLRLGKSSRPRQVRIRDNLHGRYFVSNPDQTSSARLGKSIDSDQTSIDCRQIGAGLRDAG